MSGSTRRSLVAVIGLVIGLSACGGDGTEGESPSAAGTAAASPSAPGVPPSAPGNPSSSEATTGSKPTGPPVASPSFSTPGRAAPTVVPHAGFGTISLPGVKLTSSRGPATLDRVGVAGYFLEVCAISGSTVDLELGQFTLTSLETHQAMPLMATGGYAPALQPSAVKPGTCASGYLTFDLSSAQSDAYLLTWQGAAGKAVWSFNG